MIDVQQNLEQLKFAKFQNLYYNKYINKGAVPQGSEQFDYPRTITSFTCSIESARQHDRQSLSQSAHHGIHPVYGRFVDAGADTL